MAVYEIIDSSEASSELAARSATHNDLQEMALLTEQAWADSEGHLMPDNIHDQKRLEDMQEFMESAGSWSRVIADKDKIVGFVLGRPHAEIPGAAHLRWIMVSPSYKGHGIGTHLLEWSEGYCKDEGYKKVILWTKEDNKRARNLYEHNGYELTGKTIIRDGATEPSFEYQLEL